MALPTIRKNLKNIELGFDTTCLEYEHILQKRKNKNNNHSKNKILYQKA